MSTLRRKAGSPPIRSWDGGPFRVLAYDPGGTTGWAYCEWNPNTQTEFRYFHGHLGPQEHHDDLYEHLNTWAWGVDGVPLQIVCESFEFRQHINQDQAKTGVELVSKEYIGVVNLFWQQNPNLPPIAYQTASTAKGLIPDKGPQAHVKLKQLGLYQPSMKHANDAYRHLIYYMVRKLRIREPIIDKWL